MQDDDLSSESSLYLNFDLFAYIEFLVFSDRLSSAILVYRSARAHLDGMRERLVDDKKSGRHRVSGWEGGSDMVMDENLGVVEDSYLIAAGAATVSAVAGLESLLTDLVPDGQDAPSGLHNLVTGFLNNHRQHLSRSKHKGLVGKELKLGQRRNQLAHALTGSYFDRSNASSDMFSEKALEETFHLVGSLARWPLRFTSCGSANEPATDS
ncbi:hypothetical protein [Mycolicibacterium porcinum]|uniref:hypothetical protein n=1 Tax=Mycolicibacterium porcinum TaxID=39693 RepID=UPI0010550205|nr:hypothetical protein [Mycolicibacterium porcinum]